MAQVPTSAQLCEAFIADLSRVWHAVSVFALPELDNPQIHAVTGHQVHNAVLSPDGTRIALIASSIHTARVAVVVLDRATDTELFNRRCDVGADLVFTPDGDTLLVTARGFRTGPPVDLISIPSP
jgi:hypothetical protein